MGREDPLEEGTATHSSILAWRIQWTRTWQAIVRGLAKGRTWLKQRSMHAHGVTAEIYHSTGCQALSTVPSTLKKKKIGKTEHLHICWPFVFLFCCLITSLSIHWCLNFSVWLKWTFKEFTFFPVPLTFGLFVLIFYLLLLFKNLFTKYVTLFLGFCFCCYV